MSAGSETEAWPPATSTYESHPDIRPGYCSQYAAELRARMAWQTALTAPVTDNRYIGWAADKAQHVFDLLVSRDTGPIAITPLSEGTWRIDAVAEWWRKRDGEDERDCELIVLVGRGINRDMTRRMHDLQPGDGRCTTILNGEWAYDEAAMERIREWAEAYQGAGDEAAKEQAVAVDREAKLRKWTEHDIVRVGNLISCPRRYMVRGDAIIPWGCTLEMDPAAMVDAACALEIPIMPWE